VHVPQKDITFGNRPRIEPLRGDTESGRIGRGGKDDGVDLGVPLVNRAVQTDRLAGIFTLFLLSRINLDQICRLNLGPVLLIGSYNEHVTINARGEASLSAGQ